MVSKLFVVATMVAFVQARFQQEQIPVAAVQAVQGGQPGQADTLAGAVPGVLLGGANPCAKLQLADQIIAELGNGSDSIAAAIGVVAAEQNFNNFTLDRPAICDDPTLPVTPVLRGITPLIDPGVVDAAVANQLEATSKVTPFDATGLSIAQLLAQHGFTTFTTEDATGNVGPTGAELAAGASSTNTTTTTSSDDSTTSSVETVAAVDAASTSCPATVTVTVAAAATTAADSTTTDIDIASSTNTATDAGPTGDAGAIGNFGSCTVPQIIFGTGFDGRKETAFEPLDKVSYNHDSADNIGVITSFICLALTNTCDADQTAKNTCAQATTAANTGTPLTGIQADLFNAVFGIKTNFAAVASVSNTGEIVAGTGGDSTVATVAEAAATTAADTVSATSSALDVIDSATSTSSGPAATSTVTQSTIPGQDFGLCVPTMEFLGGLDNRPPTEFTFQAIDPLIATGQEEALNPAIIVNRICDQLVNVCQASATSHEFCLTQKAAFNSTDHTVQAAIAWNTALGFADAFTAADAIVVTTNAAGATVPATAAAATSTGTAARRSDDLYRRRAIEGVRKRSSRVQ